jgi:biopolymer transport protein TolQ
MRGEELLIFLAAWLWQEQVASSSSLADLIFRASPIAKFVLLILLIFSLGSWAIIIAKELATKKAQRQSAEFLQVFQRSSRLSDLYATSSAFGESPLAAIALAAHEEIRAQTGQAAAERPAALNLEAVSRVMQSAAIAETTRLERSLGWLASTASATPFIGLFGTVVGIIIAFQGLSQAASASIQAVAPGIAEALVATAAGIAAAVPAVLAYNHYLNRIKLLAADMDSFSLRLLNLIERELGNPEIAKDRRAQIIPLGNRE